MGIQRLHTVSEMAGLLKTSDSAIREAISALGLKGNRSYHFTQKQLEEIKQYLAQLGGGKNGKTKP
jgi:hypothetical protein